MKRSLAFALTLALPFTAHAQRLPAENPRFLKPPFMETMPWTDIRDAIAGGKKVAIIPVGGVEQNGPHMTLGKHNDIVTFAAGLMAEKLNGLVAPTVKWVPEGRVPTGTSAAQPGTLTNPSPYYESLLDAAVRSEKVHGFTEILLIGDSGGNQPGLIKVADSLNKEWAGTGVKVYALNEYYAKSHADIYAWLEKDFGYARAVVGSHAGIMDTSQLMYVNPDAVRTANILLNGGGRGSGVNGDPTKATAELGKKMIDMKVDAGVAQYRRLKGGE
jgi:creatinine amidohydrolase